ncbi:hypothetical protein ACUM5Y_04975 [Marinomonas dokdonensis]|uniref:hypothetical protein n=1 Tax=Marinomonas dokdonensis TaxID=328224 RepID=UPI0040556D16
MKANKTLLTLTTFAALSLVGCASNPDSSDALQADAIQSEANSQIAQVKADLDTAIEQLNQAERDELSWFAKDSMEAANEALDAAKESYSEFEFDPSKASDSTGFFSSKTYIEATNESLALFNQHYNQAQNIRTEAMTTLATAFDNRHYLEELDANLYFPKTVTELNKELKSLVDSLAEGDKDEAIEKQPSLTSKQNTLIIKVTTVVYLGDADEQLQKLLKADIADHAPKSLSQASASLTAAKAFIAADPRAIEAIIAKSDGVYFFLDHAEQVATAVKHLKGTSAKDYETYILDLENILLEISEALGAEDGRDQALTEQGKAIVSFIKQSLEDAETALQSQQDDKTTLENQQLALDAKDSQINNLRVQLGDLNAQLTAAKNKQASLQQALDAATQTPQENLESDTLEETDEVIVEEAAE